MGGLRERQALQMNVETKAQLVDMSSERVVKLENEIKDQKAEFERQFERSKRRLLDEHAEEVRFLISTAMGQNIDMTLWPRLHE